jgi:hypothetical protein
MKKKKVTKKKAAKKRVAKKRVAKKREPHLSAELKDLLRGYLEDAALKYSFISGETDIPVRTVRYYARKWNLPRLPRR